MNSREFHQLYKAFHDPFAFLTKHVHTLDPVMGITPYPDWQHLRRLSGALLSSQRILVVKSRQMMATWTSLGLLLHQAIFGSQGIYLLLSRNERSAKELLDRLRFIIAGLPKHFRPGIGTNNSEELEFSGIGVRILSLPATPDAPRMHSPAGVIWDEMAFTPHSEDIWTALKPALDSGGFFWGISSSGGPGNVFARLAANPSEYGLKSMWLHYSEHPHRGEDWVNEARKGLSRERWAREYEISFEFAEDRVYSDFERRTHILVEPYRVRTDLPIYRSVDFGYYHPVVLYIQKTTDDRIIIIDEWIGERATIQDLHDAICHMDATYGISEKDVAWTSCDPAGHSPGDSGVSPIERLKRAGIKIRAKASRIEEGLDLVREMLREREGVPGLMVSPKAAKTVEDFGGYRMREDGLAPEKDNIHDHTMDALRYFVVNLMGVKGNKMKVGARVRGL
ncbi:hypothetical protein CEE37_05135 [candidate division LCP-89 bacterium B3_LCP]|uniref:Terminase large subunit gp17-like C-terminal domain-containing protein n=1 Tax=candidate division LCP-89 bacterium B3_LCP TaxID=2012998 RepID=A0A532V1H3_UNCL8|nr:MAG: hypothetical protein CEE37_05135 [candidate division LCP-89 bacterium B3_LCP]